MTAPGQNRRIGSIHWESACSPTQDDLLQGGERREGPKAAFGYDGGLITGESAEIDG
jgi:hypothetical protein